jgi:pyruvate/2-oxoglutarate dehydrogenase complex dihydrolipoamide dehydrogenase (E3) component
VIVGGSYIGLEFAQIFRRLGSNVTVVERANAIIAREDPDISAEITTILEAEGIAIRTGAECIRLIEKDGGVGVGLDCLQGEPEVLGSHVLLAMGREPNTDDLGLEKAGISTDARGFIKVNDRLETSVPGIYALGDCNGRGAFTHTAYNDFEIVAANLLDGGKRALSDRIVAYALFTDPPLGRVGLTASEAQRQGFEIEVGERPMSRVGRAAEKGETQGKMKVVVDRRTKAILGAAILGPGGDEAIHSLITAMAAGLTADDAQRIVPIHPTVAELVPTILGERGPS